LSFDEMAGVMTGVLGRPVAYVDLPRDIYRQGLIGTGMPEWLARDLSVLEDATRGTTMLASDGVERLAGHPPRHFVAFMQDYKTLFG
jgi:hypothetical protein